MRRFEGRVALVTGSTQGVGEAVARRLSAEGASVVVTGRAAGRGESVAAELDDAMFVPAELSDVDAVRGLVAATDERYGRLDVLVNAAGLSDRGTIVDTTPELFDLLMAVNVRAPLLLMQGAIAIMRREGRGGAIVNVGSVASYGSLPFLTAYASSKAALVTMSRNVAYSVMWDRIRVNVVNPGWIDTPGEDVVQRRFHDAPDDWLARAEATQPFGRLIKPDELARVVAFVASDDAGLMTGAVIDFDQSVIGAGRQPTPAPEETP